MFVKLLSFLFVFELDIFSIDVSWSLKAELNDTELAALWRTAVMLAENHGGFDAWQKSEKMRRSFSYIFIICLVCSILDIFFQN